MARRVGFSPLVRAWEGRFQHIPVGEVFTLARTCVHTYTHSSLPYCFRHDQQKLGCNCVRGRKNPSPSMGESACTFMGVHLSRVLWALQPGSCRSTARWLRTSVLNIQTGFWNHHMTTEKALFAHSTSLLMTSPQDGYTSPPA